MDYIYYKVIVKILIESGVGKDGDVKYKKSQEIYIVKAGSPQDAGFRVEKEMEGLTYEWKIDSIKEVKITAIL